jgi:hypothetical protein
MLILADIGLDTVVEEYSTKVVLLVQINNVTRRGGELVAVVR